MSSAVWIRKFYRSIFHKISTRLYYRWKKKRMVKFYNQFIKPGSLCFDIGACVGIFSETFLDLGAKVIAVEPIIENFNHLNERLSSKTKLFTIHAAVSALSGTSQIHKANLPDLSTLDENFVKFNEAQSQTKWTETRVVQLTTLDELIKKYGLPDFCKIDVEGHEREVLLGLTNMIPVISFEYLFPFKSKALECIERISKLSPNTVYNYSLYEFFELENEAWLDTASFMTCIKKLGRSHWTGDIFCKMA